jgi:HlyD family secretion protein
MTANVRIVSQRRDNVLRVPNAALRFKPPPDLVAAAPAGGPPGAGGAGWTPIAGDGGVAPERQRGPGGGGGGWMARRGSGEGGGPRGPGGGGGGRRPGEGGGRTSAQVYRPEGDKVVTVRFRPGIADDEYTEVIGGRLSLGDEVVLDASGGGIQAPAPAARPGGGLGGGMRGRGPRLF